MAMPPIEAVLISLFSAIVGGLIVAIANHWLTQKRENRKAKADISLKYRVEAWRAIDSLQGRDDHKPLEAAVSDILLFGTDEEIIEAKRITVGATQEGWIDLTALPVMLRKNIRSDLGLSETSVKHFWFRSGNNKTKQRVQRTP